MDCIVQPTGWQEMREELFEEYLKVCPDYRRETYCNASRYSYAHNGKRFAVLTTRNQVFVHPDVAAQV